MRNRAGYMLSIPALVVALTLSLVAAEPTVALSPRKELGPSTSSPVDDNPDFSDLLLRKNDASENLKSALPSPNSSDPTWYDIYMVGLTNGPSELVIDSRQSQWDTLPPQEVTQDIAESIVDKVDTYFRSNTGGAVRARLARWIPFSPSTVGSCDAQGLTSAAGNLTGITPTHNQVVVAIANEPCDLYAGVAIQGGGTIGLAGTLSWQVLGHEFGHSNLGLLHPAWSPCGHRDALTSCPDFMNDSPQNYFGTSIMASPPSDLVTPLLPSDLERLGTLTSDNATTFSAPPASPQDIGITNLNRNQGIKAIRLDDGADHFYVSYSNSTNYEHEPSVQVAQYVSSSGDVGTLIPENGVDVPQGKSVCGLSGYCIRVVSQVDGGAVVRVWARTGNAPMPVTNLQTQVDANGVLTASWEPPAAGPGIEGYEVQVINEDENYSPFTRYKFDHHYTPAARPTWIIDNDFGRWRIRVAADTSNGISDYVETEELDNRALPTVYGVGVTPGKLGTAKVDVYCGSRGWPLAGDRYWYTDNESLPVDQWQAGQGSELTGLQPSRAVQHPRAVQQRRRLG